MPRRAAGSQEETKRRGQWMRPKIYLFGANPFALGERLGTETQW